MSYLLPFCPNNSLKNQNFEKVKKTLGDTPGETPFFYCVLQMTIIWSMAPEIWMKCNKQNFFSFWIIFSPFTSPHPPSTPQKKNSKKIKEMLRDITILDMCTINQNYVMYSSWDIEHDRQIFLYLWVIFCPFTPKQPRSSKFWKMKENTKISSFYTSAP